MEDPVYEFVEDIMESAAKRSPYEVAAEHWND